MAGNCVRCCLLLYSSCCIVLPHNFELGEPWGSLALPAGGGRPPPSWPSACLKQACHPPAQCDKWACVLICRAYFQQRYDQLQAELLQPNAQVFDPTGAALLLGWQFVPALHARSRNSRTLCNCSLAA